MSFRGETVRGAGKGQGKGGKNDTVMMLSQVSTLSQVNFVYHGYDPILSITVMILSQVSTLSHQKCGNLLRICVHLRHLLPVYLARIIIVKVSTSCNRYMMYF